MKKLSIITINYNNFEGLKKTVESVFNQTWKEFEYIVIDGGSTDGSTEYLESCKDKIDYFISEKDSGVYNAMNKGIKVAKGEYLLFLNSGDYLYSNITLQENQGNITNYDLVYFNIELTDGKSSRIVTYPEKLRFSFFYFGTICHQSTLIKKTLFEIVGYYDENLKLVSDWKFFILALFKFNCSYVKADSTFVTYDLNGISSNLVNEKILEKERKQVLNSDFRGHIEDISQIIDLKRVISDLRESRKIRWLVKLRFLKKF